MFPLHRFAFPICLVTLGLTSVRAVAEPRVLARYEARDTLGRPTDPDPDAQACLAGLTWAPASFPVTCEGDDTSSHRVIVRFPSPVPSGDAANDHVTMEWHRPFQTRADDAKAPAVLVVHESGRAMPVGRLFARAFQAEGIHAFLIHLPYYGLRRGASDRPESDNLVTVVRQAIADVRRARDAIASLPEVDADRIAIQGTSLGGFVVAIAASLDNAFPASFIMLAGGHLYDLVVNGQQDAANFRRDLERAGYTGDALRKLLWQIEPTRVAHRLDPQRTWLYTAAQDRVIPLENAQALARAARLDEDHHVSFPGDHYTAIVHFATIVRQVAARIRDCEHGQADVPPSRR
ncbi:MAG: prolyl oligopeptidase family serine peptidase [Pirellulaceae bacterium]|nr:prolyl oligopeptidase family serine peptidase [Pirellulaceae bacterium]